MLAKPTIYSQRTHHSLNPNKLKSQQILLREMEAYKKLVLVSLLLALSIGSETIMLANGDNQGLCHMTKEGLKACQPSVSGQNPVPPSASCCSALSNADFQCLCIFKNSNLLNFYGINSTLAMELPAKCNQAQPHC